MDWITENVKCRVNEEEGLLMNDESRMGKFNFVKSSDWEEGMPMDMI